MDTEENKPEQPQYGQYAPQPIEPQSDGGTTPEKNSGVVNLLSGDMKRKTCAIACAVALIAGCGIGFGIAWPTLRHSAEVAESADIIARSNAKYVEQLNQIEDNQEELDKIDQFEQIKDNANNASRELSDIKSQLESLDSQLKGKQSELDMYNKKIDEAKGTPIQLPAGEFVVGKDVPAGRYIISGSSNFITHSSSGEGKINTILGDDFGDGDYHGNLSDGDQIENHAPATLTPVTE